MTNSIRRNGKPQGHHCPGGLRAQGELLRKQGQGGLSLTYDKLPVELQANIDKIVPIMGYASKEELLK